MVDRPYTTAGVKGVSEEIDEAPLTVAETKERIRQHNEGKVAASAAPAPAEEDSSNSLSDASSDEDSGLSASDDWTKTKVQSTPRKPTCSVVTVAVNKEKRKCRRLMTLQLPRSVAR